MLVKISQLIESDYSKTIYDHTPPPDLVHSISENGVLDPIWITSEGKIVSGHRRVNACKMLGIEEIPCEIKKDSEILVIEANRYRQKTWIEKLNEAEAVEKIYQDKAKEHLKLSKGRGKKGFVNLPNWYDKELGWSQQTINNFINVAERFGEKTKISFFEQSALYLLSKPSTPDPARQEAIELAEEGNRFKLNIKNRRGILVFGVSGLQKRHNVRIKPYFNF